MQKYQLEQFTSHNTSFKRDIWARNWKSAESKAKKISEKMFFPVVIWDGGGWVKFEQGEQVEWSA